MAAKHELQATTGRAAVRELLKREGPISGAQKKEACRNISNSRELVRLIVGLPTSMGP